MTTFRQKILKTLYPALMLATKDKNGIVRLNKNKDLPPVPFYSLKATTNKGKELDFLDLQGKKVLIVNTASDCGYTHQYEDLEKLHKQYGKKLEIIGFPANDFKDQEKGSDEDIAQFCQVNYGVTFPLAKKANVTGHDQQSVFRWLSDKNQNGWNDKAPVWNFSKYLVDEKGMLIGFFGPAISPSDKAITSLL